jgi:hypothetical protein
LSDPRYLTFGDHLIHQETVGRYLRPKPDKVTTGSPEGTEDSKPAKVITGSCGGRSAGGPWRDVNIAGVEQGLSAVRIHQDLVHDHGFTGGYQSVQRFVRRYIGIQPLPFRRIECAPGEELQADFGRGLDQQV